MTSSRQWIRGTVRRHLSALICAAILATWLAPSAAAAVPLISTSMSVTPDVAVGGSAITYTAHVWPVSGIATNLVLTMQNSGVGGIGGTCTPAPNCTVDDRTGDPTWIFPSLTAPVTLTYETGAAPGTTEYLYIASDGVGCVTGCPSSADLSFPATLGWIDWTSSTGDARSGATLHVVVHGGATAGPLDADLQADLSTGLAAPTNIAPGTAMYAPPPSNYIDDAVQLGPSWTSLAFDTVITAANGGTVTLSAHIFSVEQADTIPITSRTIKVGIDTVAPTVTAPKTSLARAIFFGSAPAVKLTWSATDALSGADRYELARSVDGGAWVTVSKKIHGAPDALLALETGHDYRFRVRAVDRAGNVSAWATGSTFRFGGVQDTSASIHYGGTWTTQTGTSLWGGTTHSSTGAGATATYRFTGRSIAWIATYGPNRGKAQVYVDGVLKATVDLYASVTVPKGLVWTANYATSATRTVKIKVLGTSGRPRVDVDGFAVAS